MANTYLTPPESFLDPNFPTIELYEDRSCRVSARTQRLGFVRSFTRRFRLKANLEDAEVGPLTVVSALGVTHGIYLGRAYKAATEADDESVITGIDCVQGADEEDWIVTITYEPVPNPLDDPPEVRWDYQDVERIADRTLPTAANPLGLAILNSALDPFDPPVMRDDTEAILTIQRNEVSYDPALSVELNNVVNSVAFAGQPAGLVKSKPPKVQRKWSPAVSTRGGFYDDVTYEFRVRRIGWQPRILDAGMRVLDPATGAKTPALLDDGSAAPNPVPLDGNGQRLTVTGAGPIEGHFLEFRVYDEYDFNSLGLPV